MTPTFVLRIWFLGVLSLSIIGGSTYLFHDWQQTCWTWDPVLHASVFRPSFGNNKETWILAAAAALAVLAIAGGPITKGLLRLTLSASRRGEGPADAPAPRLVHRVVRPDGSEIHVEFYGSPDAVPVVLSHGWGLDSRAWNYLKRDRWRGCQLVVWDEPGLGNSTKPTNRDYSLQKLARDLEAVLSIVNDSRTILVGHSIGGMIILTFCRLFSVELKSRVSGIVLAHTTPTNPLKTISGAAVYSLLQKPVLEPLMYLTIFFSPLLRITSWLSYCNGSAQLSTMRSSFAGGETWQDVEFVARTQSAASPAVLARGMLGMMHYDALDTLPHINVPTLILAGDKDSTTLPEASKIMQLGIPGAEMEFLSPAKHLGFMEHPHMFYSMLKSFVMQISPPSQ